MAFPFRAWLEWAGTLAAGAVGDALVGAGRTQARVECGVKEAVPGGAFGVRQPEPVIGGETVPAGPDSTTGPWCQMEQGAEGGTTPPILTPPVEGAVAGGHHQTQGEAGADDGEEPVPDDSRNARRGIAAETVQEDAHAAPLTTWNDR